MKIKGIKKLEKILSAYPEMAERSTNWLPVMDDVHEIITNDFQAMFKSRAGRVGEMQNLGPSLTNPNHAEHIWRPQKTGFTFGTSVPYSFFYMQWRKAQKKRSHVQFRARARRAVRDRIMQWIVEGK